MNGLRTLTIVKTDVRRFTDRVGLMTSCDLDAFLREHRALVVAVLKRHAGHVVKEIGDSYLVTFESSTAAVLACIELQRELGVAGTDRPQDERVEVRIAVAAGDVLLQDGDIFGTPVNTVARVETVTPPGEIYFTEAVYQNLNRSEVAAQFVGEFPLKGISQPVRIYRTTFRHQTRILEAVGVLLTDIADFTKFAKSADLMAVEGVLDWWERAHREVATAHGGVVRAVIADAFGVTFEGFGQAIEAWLDLHAKAQVFNARSDRPFALRFTAGSDLGDVRLFRSALYGQPLDRADICCRECPIGGLAIPAELLPNITSQTLARVEAESGVFRTEATASRARRSGLESFLVLKPRCLGDA
jgi:adenylate cyclase